MTSPRTSFRRFSGWTALLAALALLAQGMWPASAMPLVGDGGFQVQMCTPQGLQSHADPSTPAPDASDCCGLCIMAMAASVAPAAPDVQLVAYAAAAEPFASRISRPLARARDPPRPPSQGPPLTV